MQGTNTPAPRGRDAALDNLHLLAAECDLPEISPGFADPFVGCDAAEDL